jgi:hypothetical protein
VIHTVDIPDAWNDALEELVAKYADRYSSEEECRRNVLLGAVYLGLVGMRESDAANSEGVTIQ